MPVIDVEKSSTYDFLTHNGKDPVKVGGGKYEVDPEFLAAQANALCNLLSGKGLNYYQLSIIFHVAQEAFREECMSIKF